MALGLPGESKNDKNKGHSHSQFLFYDVDVFLKWISYQWITYVRCLLRVYNVLVAVLGASWVDIP